MKFNALVVAAMVITSVNAGLPDKLPSEVENSGGRSMPVFPPDSSGNGPGKFRTIDPTDKESFDDLDDLDDYYANNANENLASSSNGAHVEEKSGGISGGDGIGEDPARYSNRAHAKERSSAREIIVDVFGRVHFESSPECIPFISKLHRLWEKAMDITYDARSQVTTLKGPSIRKKMFLIKFVNKRSKLYKMTMDKLKILKKERKALEANYRGVWNDLKEKGCWIDALDLMSPEKMIEYRSFPKF
ncbi:hypothetical protein BASA60_000663 [Batrachochytrium salamandrivorans]|nr:hypothetical protein BASA60_000663 [Batrachochytrium salamandrivorans]KAH9252323.1 hypothetical protein BASA81_009776 [Batrachochytrium salamandrivorans]KAH9272325.1 hypothetical protein BASA83_005418 [Batrachochytrium salamandrivorans]